MSYAKKILLIDFDSKIPNLAIMKLSAYHKSLGDEVYLNRCVNPDKVYISTLFTWNKPLVEKLLTVYPDAEVGGTGWDLKKNLPDAVESCKPDYDLYNTLVIYERLKGGIGKKDTKIKKADILVNAGIGFTSRGCINSCDFCGIPIKEGKFRQVAELKDIINPRSDVLILLDNNLTADPNCVDKLHEIRDRGLTVSITQGIDIRLVTPEIAQALSEVKHFTSLHYSWDLLQFEHQIIKGIKTLSKNVKTWKHMCYMLTCFNTTFEEDMYRFNRLVELGVTPYVMPFNHVYVSEKHHHFARWVNGHFYNACKFDEYVPWLKAQHRMPQLAT